MTTAELSELAFIPHDFSLKALDDRISKVDALRKQKLLDAQQLCLDTENATEIDVVLSQTAKRGRNQFTWVWREGGQKCPPISVLVRKFSPDVLRRIAEFDRLANEYNHTLGASESELTRLRETKRSGQIHECLAARE